MRSVTFITFTILVVVTVFVVFLREAVAAPRCPIEISTSVPENCTFGTTVDWCRNVVCAKGPGEECKEEEWWSNECAIGTYCTCGSCTGCFTNANCHNSNFC